MKRTRMNKACAGILILVAAGCSRLPEARRNQYLAKGKVFLAKQDYSRAILEFKNAAQVTPPDAEAYYQLGIAYLGTQDLRPAVFAFRKSMELNPKHFMAQLRYSQLMAATDNKEVLLDAQSRLKGLLQHSNANPEALNTLAFTDLKLGDPDGAIQILEQVLAQSPGEVAAALMLAQTKVAQKDFKGAEAVLKKASRDAPKVADVRRYLAEFYIDQRRMSEAETQLLSALEIDSKSAPALLDLARLQSTMGRKDEAEKSFKRLSSYAGYESMYAIFLFQGGRRDEALREFERLAKENPKDRAARTRLIVAYRSLNRPDDAKRVLRDTIQKNPRDAEALMQRGEIFLSEGKHSEAEVDLNRALTLMPTAAEVHYLVGKLHQARGERLIYRQELFSALQLNPALLAVRLELAGVLMEAKEGRTALELLGEAPESQRNSLALLVQRNWAFWASGDLPAMRKGIDEGLAQARSVDLLLQDGLWKLRANNPREARISLEEALKVDPSDIRALQGLRQTYLAQKNAPLALQNVKEYAARQPNSAAVQDFLGMLLLAEGDISHARKVYTNIKVLDPQFVKADFSLVQMDIAEGKLPDARKKLEAIMAASAGNVTARLWLGIVQDSMGEYSSAIEQFRKVVEVAPNDAQASNNLAYLLTEHQNQADTALKYAQHAVELEPEDPAFRDTLGWVLYRKGLYPQAVKHLEVAALSKANVIWKYHLAMAYARSGDISRGRATLATALKINAKVPEAKMAQELVGSAR